MQEKSDSCQAREEVSKLHESIIRLSGGGGKVSSPLAAEKAIDMAVKQLAGLKANCAEQDTLILALKADAAAAAATQGAPSCHSRGGFL